LNDGAAAIEWHPSDAHLLTPQDVLRRVFGYPAFRGLQEAAISQVMAGGDALVLMPTGGGKSLCYQVPALCMDGTAIVVSPLIALMDDQVAALRQLGVAAGALHSEVEPDRMRETSALLDSGRLDLLYVSPERLLMPGTLERLTRQRIALIAIDEAHCVSAWGHEFRPEYRGLAQLAQRFPGVPRIALTATADPRTRADILAALDMPEAAIYTASFHRPNLHIAAQAKEGETAELLEVIGKHRDQAGIVYCGSRNKTERIAQRLKDKGVTAMPFHAGLSPMEKRVALTRFRSGESVVMVATIAFGMGIDRPDVRFVVHLDMPDSPEAFYQQIGRAGRDGDPADTLLLYGGEDIARARHWLAQSIAPEAQKRVMRDRLEVMISLTETTSCRTRALLACFGEELGAECGHCDNCRNPVATFDGTVDAQKVLSAIYRTGQMFGAVHIVSVLRGQETPMVVKHGHDRLPTYGVGNDRQPGFWRGVIRQLIARGALQTGSGDYASLTLVQDAARPILRGETKVMLRDEPERAPRTRAPRDRERAAETSLPPGDPTFEALRQWRATEARQQGVPPYVIFHDSVLREIASVRPSGLDALAELRGVGASKLERYGDAVLGVVRQA
jgi:ATP-dependent DNA helicase RecQ